MPPGSNEELQPIIRLENIVKRFGGALALDNASLRVERGSIHGLVGQNGAGKSTLIKILAGLHGVEGGSIEIDGVALDRLTPQLVEKLGIHFIHQDRFLVPTFTVGEALFLGHEPRVGKTPFLNRRAMRDQAEAILDRYFGVRLRRNALIAELTTAEKQIIQITRALLDKPKVLIFDEPTAALVHREAEILFRLIRRLRDEGVTILYISHYLSEIEALCDTVTVLRNGKDVARLAVAETSAAEIAGLMIARDINDLYPKSRVEIGSPVLTLEELSLAGKFDSVSFSLHRGEILGVTGLLGSGVKELVRVLFGLETPTSGRITIGDQSHGRMTPDRAVHKRVALVPEDRRKHGVALDLSVKQNISLANLSRLAKFGLLWRTREGDEAAGLIERLQIKTASSDALVRTLSGGNQQKVAIAKWLSRQSEIYLLDEPTVGVDIAAKIEIYKLIAELVGKGASVLIVSSDLQELLGISDRVLVMFRGRITGSFLPSQTTPDALLAETTGSGETLRHVG